MQLMLALSLQSVPMNVQTVLLIARSSNQTLKFMKQFAWTAILVAVAFFVAKTHMLMNL